MDERRTRARREEKRRDMTGSIWWEFFKITNLYPVRRGRERRGEERRER